MSNETSGNKARYDNYRLIRLTLKAKEHVELFQELEEESDSYTFYGHAREVGQNLTILVTAHKIYEISDIIERNELDFTVLVCDKNSYHYKIISLCYISNTRSQTFSA